MNINELPKEQLLLLLKQKPETWNQLRKAFPDYVPNLSKQDLGGCDLSGVDLSKVNFIRANLNGANLSKCRLNSANLINAELAGVNFSGATLTDANLQNANLAGANFNRVELSRVNFTGATLRGALLNRVDLAQATLLNADLSDANLLHADLSQAHMEGARLVNANCTHADLTGVHAAQCDFSGAILNEARLHEAALAKASFHLANLSWADLSKADLRGARFVKSDLGEADLSEAVLEDATFEEAVMRGADLSGASLVGARLFRSVLDNVHFEETRFGETWLVNTSLAGAEGTGNSLFLAPCSLDHRTLLRSPGLAKSFLQGAGLPDVFFESVAQARVSYCACYLAYSNYSGPDSELAERLVEGLHREGIRCWLVPYESREQAGAQNRIANNRRGLEPLVVIVSPHSLYSDWLKSEVLHGYFLAQKVGRRLVLPVSVLDDDELAEWQAVDPKSGVDAAVSMREGGVPSMGEWREDELFAFAVKNLADKIRAAAKG
ncbi:pentapeptide repeat-containing protein [Acanthopleuribacter pedis]|uniref:Pentapeptide repeat-containing protein n=1 Tax=Acanthopleuribacter pedis TaxID=442870 RepID=A0A8J7QB68_9BACT|nr:pentapeptide repeat-containing protein [Acanthopleuribacter pedis]MBO1321237.1 pentapeptide repeat-containing protein [Acanthopleuribacter pedis]